LTRIFDQQFVAHAFAATRGPRADAARHAVSEIWRGCGPLFGMTAAIPGTGLPAQFPTAAALDEAVARGGEVALAARERPGTSCQAVLRLHHDTLNLSVGLAPPEASSASGAGTWPWWRDLDYLWGLLLARHEPHLFGEARLFLTRVDAEAAIRAADPALYIELARLLPDSPASVAPVGDHARAGQGTDAVAATAPVGVSLSGGFAIWEVGNGADARAARRLLMPVTPDADAQASAWAWSVSDTAIPPLARYLLHAAKIRYELRVWQRDSRARQLWEWLDSTDAELRRTGTGDPAALALLRPRRMDALYLHAELRALRHTVEIAADNLGRGLDLAGLMIPGGMFADDVSVGRWLLERIDDEASYLAIASDRAEQVLAILPPAPALSEAAAAAGARVSTGDAPAAVDARVAEDPIVEAAGAVAGGPPRAIAGAANDRRRNVFVVYGRDDPARREVFAFLRSLGLRPLEWEELVKATGTIAPFLCDTARMGLELATAAVVLLTPEDVVHLHPDLHGPAEPATETGSTLQARPNVLIELGMALAAKPAATLVLIVGEQRHATDLGGMSYVNLSDPDCRSRIANRLKVAGCLVDEVGTDWLKTGDFAGLAAQHRMPVPH
jgi:predicted nucleotide-binding protein